MAMICDDHIFYVFFCFAICTQMELPVFIVFASFDLIRPTVVVVFSAERFYTSFAK